MLVSSTLLVLVVSSALVVVVSATVTEVFVLVVNDDVSVTMPVGSLEVAEEPTGTRLEVSWAAEELASPDREDAWEDAALRAEVEAELRAEAALEEAEARDEDAASRAEEAEAPTWEVKEDA